MEGPADDLVLRPAAGGDVDFILALEARPAVAALIQAWPRARYEAALDDPDLEVLIVEAGGQPAGFVNLAGLARADGRVELMRIVIDPPGQGIGRRAMQAVIGRIFTRHKARRLWLDVFEDNVRARHLYRALGFRETGERRQVTRGDGQPGTLVIMALSPR